MGNDRSAMSQRLWTIYERLDTDADGYISQQEMEKILDDEEALRLLQSMGVDVSALVYECPMICESIELQQFSFADFVEVVWQFRPSIAAALRLLSTLRRSVHGVSTTMVELISAMEASGNYQSNP